MTCGRSGVGSITTIDVRIDGTDGWLFNWIEIETGFETFRFEGNVLMDNYETLRLFRSPMNTRKSHSSMNARKSDSPTNALTLRRLRNVRKYESVLFSSSQLTVST